MCDIWARSTSDDWGNETGFLVVFRVTIGFPDTGYHPKSLPLGHVRYFFTVLSANLIALTFLNLLRMNTCLYNVHMKYVKNKHSQQ